MNDDDDDIMLRSVLRNKLNKKPSLSNRSSYKSKRNICVELLRKMKREYFSSLDIKVFDDNKSFWKTFNPLFSDKQRTAKSKITLVEVSSDSIISNKIGVAEKLNNFFSDTVKNYDIVKYIPDHDQSNADIYEIIDKYSQHPSILKINEYIETSDIFDFTNVTTEEMYIGIKSLKQIRQQQQRT